MVAAGLRPGPPPWRRAALVARGAWLALALLAGACAEGTSVDAGNGGPSGGSGGAAAGGTGGAGAAGGTGGASAAGGAGAVGGSGVAGTAGASGGAGTVGDAAVDQRADADVDLCAGVTCVTPPASTCSDATTLRVYQATGTCDRGACVYPSTPTLCSQGCAAGACVNDPCRGITCATPPANTCADAATLTVYQATGTCDQGQCSYGSTPTACPQGCAADACVNDPCLGVSCSTPPANACADASTLTVYQPAGACALGQCVYTSTPTPCAQGCAAGACVNDPCLGLTCAAPPASYCSAADTLTVYDSPGTCSGGLCAYATRGVYCAFGCVGGACRADPCLGVSCGTPPASYCSAADTLTVYDTPGTCQAGLCSYGNHPEFCAFGCVSGACRADPCLGVPCNTPPAAYCTSATAARTYAATGTCSGGTCSYAPTDSPCPYGCAAGVCQNCTVDGDCGAGRWCAAGTCAACSTDQRCGAACADCTAQGAVCAGGTSCVECTQDSHCGAGEYCAAGACAPCDVAARCGPSCVACSGSTPVCSGGACACTAGSCPANQACSGSACAVCKSDTACGAACGACGGSTPRCLDQGSTSSCVQCLTSADCSGGQVCGSAHTCVSACVPPATACSASGSQDGGCANAYRISRTSAGGASGFTVNNTYGLCGRANNFNGGCDTRNGSDAEYRLFMLQGETVVVSLTRGSSTCTVGWSGTVSLRIYQDACADCAACGSPTCTTQPYCTTSNTQSPSFVAPANGWYTFVVDSNGPVEDKGGVFSLNVRLTCAGTCGC